MASVVGEYNEQYRVIAVSNELERPNLDAFYALMRFIASPDRSDEVWAAVGGKGLQKPSLTEKKHFTH
ncbi:MAG: hypothetical protein EBT20_12985 [Alphaproteobacteria bacterium]|nr:hypothetical protein [Alphaproteobacteria bacterium]